MENEVYEPCPFDKLHKYIVVLVVFDFQKISKLNIFLEYASKYINLDSQV